MARADDDLPVLDPPDGASSFTAQGTTGTSACLALAELERGLGETYPGSWTADWYALPDDLPWQAVVSHYESRLQPAGWRHDPCLRQRPLAGLRQRAWSSGRRAVAVGVVEDPRPARGGGGRVLLVASPRG